MSIVVSEVGKVDRVKKITSIASQSQNLTNSYLSNFNGLDENQAVT